MKEADSGFQLLERGGVPSDNELSGGSRGVGGDIIVDGLVGSLGAFDDEAVGCRTSLNQADAALAVGSGDPSVSEGMDIEVHKPPSLSLGALNFSLLLFESCLIFVPINRSIHHLLGVPSSIGSPFSGVFFPQSCLFRG